MSIRFSTPFKLEQRGGGPLAVASLDLHGHGFRHSPIVMFDDFVVSGHPFAPHPHAGFSAVTYLFPDSLGRLRSRDSLGNDYVVGPGGIVWTQAARGVMHEEMLADAGRSLHGLQFFVNLTGDNKDVAPEVFALDGAEVPVWEGEDGAQARVVVGTYRGVASPVVPAEPFTLLDMTLAGEMPVVQAEDGFGLIYATAGTATVASPAGTVTLQAGAAIIVEGAGTMVLSGDTARALYMSAPAVREAVVQSGPFIMRDAAGVAAAAARYHRGEMGRLAPLNR